jgi:predicted dehydrogenase
MQSPVRLGIVGCGYVAQNDYLPVLARPDIAEKVHVVALCDVIPERASSLAARYGWEHAYTDYEEMLAESALDLVAVLTPIPFHYDQARKALETGSHVYVQKTMTGSTAEARELAQIAVKHGRLLSASPGQMIDRYHRRAEQLIAGGAIGHVCFARGQGPHPGHETQDLGDIDPSWYYQNGGGPLADVAVYPLTSITGLIGPAKRVTAFAGTAIPNRSWQGKPLEVNVPDSAAMVLEFDNGVLAAVHANFVTKATDAPQVEIFGSSGVLELGGWTRRDAPLRLYSEGPGSSGGEAGWSSPPLSSEAYAEPQLVHTVADLLHVVNCVATGETPRLSADHATHVIDIIEQAQESARSGTAKSLTTTFTTGK